MTNQPVWKLLANLGDVNPVDHGGLFVYQDLTGVYPEECEKLVSPDDDNGTWYMYRFILDRLELHGKACLVPFGFTTRTDLPYPIESYEEWFSKDIEHVAETIGESADVLRLMFCSADPIERARAYESIGDYHGFDNLDSYPLIFSNRSDVTARYTEKNK